MFTPNYSLHAKLLAKWATVEGFARVVGRATVLSETDNSGEGIENVFDKSMGTVDENF
jgi:hypothetical protein